MLQAMQNLMQDKMANQINKPETLADKCAILLKIPFDGLSPR